MFLMTMGISSFLRLLKAIPLSANSAQDSVELYMLFIIADSNRALSLLSGT